jgi:hypothetical protein
MKSIAESITLLSAATTVAAGAGVRMASADKTFQASGTTTAGAGSATILVQGSNDDTNYDTIGTITLTLATTTGSDSFKSADRYKYVRGNVTAISGTGAAVSLTAGY